MSLFLVLTLLAVALLLHLVLWHVLFARAIRRPAPPASGLARYPSVTIVRPVRGSDADQLDNFRAALDTGYPGEVETLFAFDTEDDPGVANARRAIQEHRAGGRPGSARLLIVGPPPADTTGKLNAMIAGAREAAGELIAFGDSDTRPDRELLRVLVETLVGGAPRTGCTFPPVVVPGRLETAGDVAYAVMLNGLYGPAAARAAGTTGELPFIMGQTMLFTREALDAIGGVECARGQLVDDMYLGRRVKAAGLRNVMVKHPLQIMSGGWSLTDFLGVYRRWLFFSRNGLSLRFTWPLWSLGVGFGASLAVGVLGPMLGQPVPAVIAGVTLLLYGWSAADLQRRFGGPRRVPWRLAWMLYGMFLLAPIVLASLLWPRVNWRGRSYPLGGRARLAEHRSPEKKARRENPPHRA